jgi:hypothetical protein
MSSRYSYVGRTLLPAAFDPDLDLIRIKPTSKSKAAEKSVRRTQHGGGYRLLPLCHGYGTSGSLTYW